MKKAVLRLLGQAQGWKKGAVAVVIVASCQSGSDRKVETIDVTESRPPPRQFGNVAYAATIDAGAMDAALDSSSDASDAADDAPPDSVRGYSPLMPSDPVQVTLRFPKTGESIALALLSGEPYPYDYEVMLDGDQMIVTLFAPRKVEMGLVAIPLDADGQPVGEVAEMTLKTFAKVSTVGFHFGGTHTIIELSEGAQRQLQLGDNFCDGPVTEEVICGVSSLVHHEILKVDKKTRFRIDVIGSQGYYVFTNERPEFHSGPSEVDVEAGGILALYPVVIRDDAGVAEPSSVTLTQVN